MNLVELGAARFCIKFSTVETFTFGYIYIYIHHHFVCFVYYIVYSVICY